MASRKVRKGYVHALVSGLSVCALVACFCSVAYAADWPHWRGPDYNGISNESGWTTDWPQSGPKVLWKAELGIGFASMAVSNGRVYGMGNIHDNDVLYCFDAKTGRLIWKTSYPCPLFAKSHEGGPCGTPTVDGDAVYTFGKDGDALRFNAETGEIVWHRNLHKELGVKPPTWYFACSPLLLGDLVVLNAGTYGIALHKTDGHVVWQNGKGIGGYATGVPFSIDGQACVAMLACRELVCFDPVTGEVLWKVPWRTAYDINAADVIVSGDKLFVSSGYNKGCALYKVGKDSATEIWHNKNMRNQVNSCVLWKGYLYGFDGQVGGGGKLACVNFQTGQAEWSRGGLGTGSLMLADGKLIILGERGKLVIAQASPQGFKELASAQILKGKCWTVPVLANGRIYARNAAGQLVCLDVSGG